MILAAHQIHFLPGLRYFSKMMSCDVFVFLDDVQFVKREFQNRNKIRTATGWQYLTVPVITKNKGLQLIRDVEINNSYDWRKEHIKTIETNYRRARYFDVYFGEIFDIYQNEYKHLIDISLRFMDFFMKKLMIKTKTVFSSSLGIKKTSTERLIDICKKLNADTYLSGIGAKDYLNEELFYKEGIKVIWQNFEIKPYPQVFKGFIPNMSFFDLLMNTGPNSRNYL